PIRFRAHDDNLYRYVGNSVTTSVDPTGTIKPDDEKWKQNLREGTWQIGGTHSDLHFGCDGWTPSFSRDLRLEVDFPPWLGRLSDAEKTQIAMFGCGGVAAARTNVAASNVHHKKGARCFYCPGNAAIAFRDAQWAGSLGGKGQKYAIVAVQSNRPIHRQPSPEVNDGKPFRVFTHSNEIDPHQIHVNVHVSSGGVQNWATLISTPEGPTWEWANHAAWKHDYDSDPMEIYHSRKLPPKLITAFCMIPGSKIQSPHLGPGRDVTMLKHIRNLPSP
ncbi:MAG: hypothetical protein ACYSWU_26585, partial [Planctomycetota bacterium]